MADPPNRAVPQFYLDGEPHLTPDQVVDYFCESRGIPREQITVKPVVVATFFPELSSFLATRHGGKASDYWTVKEQGRELYTLDDAVCVARLPVGAPAATHAVEELIACGARTLLIVGAAGSLRPDLPIGSVTLPLTAVREEGTSHHYLPSDVPAAATTALVSALEGAWKGGGVEPRAGIHWTTDAPYREHKQKIAAYREAGVLSVDMEVSALFAVAQHRGVGCAAILAISDELYEPWRMGFGMPEFQRTMARAGLAALEAGFALASGPGGAPSE